MCIREDPFSLPFCVPFPFLAKQSVSDAHLRVRENPASKLLRKCLNNSSSSFLCVVTGRPGLRGWGVPFTCTVGTAFRVELLLMQASPVAYVTGISTSWTSAVLTSNTFTEMNKDQLDHKKSLFRLFTLVSAY